MNKSENIQEEPKKNQTRSKIGDREGGTQNNLQAAPLVLNYSRLQGVFQMPKGSPTKQTIATAKYQEKIGYTAKSFKIKRELSNAFKDACDRAGQSQSYVISEFMRDYITKH